MVDRRTELIVTLGPSTSTETDLRRLRDKGVDFVRVNLSHSSLDDLRHFIGLSKRVGIPFIIDTEGSQIRTGKFRDGEIYLRRDDQVRIHREPVVGDDRAFSLTPSAVVAELEVGDVIYVDFDTAILLVVDTSTAHQGYIEARAIGSGAVGSNKAVVLDRMYRQPLNLPALSPKDLRAIEIGLAEGIDQIAVSFVRSGEAVDEARRITRHSMRVISKIECVDALDRLDEIVAKTDALLLDRGDLSKEIPIEQVPFVQRLLLAKARAKNKPVYVATNLLETMVSKERPTRAEVHDVVATVLGGAAGVTLAAETAIGKYPIACVNMLNRIVLHAEHLMDNTPIQVTSDPFGEALANDPTLGLRDSSLLVSPHGGNLVDRMRKRPPDPDEVEALPRVAIDASRELDVLLIGMGAYSPLTGFMVERDLRSVVSDLRLADGTPWPVPITLPVSPEIARGLDVGDTVALTDGSDRLVALLRLEDAYPVPSDAATGLDPTAAGGRPVTNAAVLLGGTLEVLPPTAMAARPYELTPRQLRHLFDDLGWATVLAIEEEALEIGTVDLTLVELELDRCDGVLLQSRLDPAGPRHPEVRSRLEILASGPEAGYGRDRIVPASLPGFARSHGLRRSLLNAICLRNFGCSHLLMFDDLIDDGQAIEEAASIMSGWGGLPHVEEIGVRMAVFRSDGAARLVG